MNAQGNLAGGHSPPWHGASAQALEAGGQRNASALSGWKTQEFGGGGGSGAGFNQLVFDDSDQQLRVQLASTQHATQLNLGHLIHQADNHRGSFRGLGFELRTDAYGVVRAKQGLLITSFGTTPGEPAGDNAAGIALAGQMLTLGQAFSDAAKTHQTVQLAGWVGSFKPWMCTLSEQGGPLKALHTALKGMVARDSLDQAISDAGQKHTATGADKLPHTTDPIVAISAKAGLAVAAGQEIQWAAAKRIVMSVAGGASITLEGGNITVMCPGTMTIKAGVKSFVGPERASYPLPIWTRGDFNLPCAQAAADRAKAFIRLR